MQTMTRIAMALIAVAGWNAAFGEDALRQGVEGAARKIAAVAKQAGAESVTVIAVEDGTTLGSTATGGVERLLKDSLAKSITVKETRGAIGIKARLLAVKGEFGDRALRIEFRLTDAFGDEVSSFDGEYLIPKVADTPVDDKTVLGKDGKLKEKIGVQKGTVPHDINDAAALWTAFGVNGQTGVLGENFKTNEELLKSPDVFIAGGNAAKTSQKSPFSVRILVDGAAKPLRMVDGQPFVDLKPGERFSVDVVNEGTQFVATQVMIDGLNSFYFSETPKAHGDTWILPPSDREGVSRLQMEGWYKRRGVADKFVATTYDESKRKQAGLDAAPIGGVTVLFRGAQLRQPKSKEPIRTESVQVEVPREGGGTAKVTVQVAQPGATQGVFIGGGGDVAQREGDPTKYEPAPYDLQASITIRYRHPKQ
jgi:hypothetical protein